MSYSSSSLKSGGPSLSLIENNKNQPNVGIGNYKGVMLCNRPFAGSVGKTLTLSLVLSLLTLSFSSKLTFF